MTAPRHAEAPRIRPDPYASRTTSPTTPRRPHPGFGCAQHPQPLLHIDAAVTIPEQGAEGVLVAQATASAATACTAEGQLAFTYNYADLKRFTVTASDRLPAGKHMLEMASRPNPATARRMATLSLDGRKIARAGGTDPGQPLLARRHSTSAKPPAVR